MAAGSPTNCHECVPLSVQCIRRACEVERQQRERALTRLDSHTDELTGEQRAVVAELARSLTCATTPVAIETLRAIRSQGDERPRARSADAGAESTHHR